MKSRLFKLSFLLIFLTIFFGCCEDCETSRTNLLSERDSCKNELETLKNHLGVPFNYQEFRPTQFDFCNTTESILPKNKYNTKTGIAQFSVPIPKGSNLKFIKMDSDVLYYECNGHNRINYGDNDLINENEIAINLPMKEGHRIWVEVKFINFIEDDCIDIDMYQEKKKKSEVEGEPIN